MASHTEQQVGNLLRDYSTSDAWINRQLGAQLVAQYQYTSLLQEVLHLLSDRNDWVRYHALVAASQFTLTPHEILKRVSPLQSDPFFRVRQKATEILATTAANTDQRSGADRLRTLAG